MRAKKKTIAAIVRSRNEKNYSRSNWNIINHHLSCASSKYEEVTLTSVGEHRGELEFLGLEVDLMGRLSGLFAVLSSDLFFNPEDDFDEVEVLNPNVVSHPLRCSGGGVETPSNNLGMTGFLIDGLVELGEDRSGNRGAGVVHGEVSGAGVGTYWGDVTEDRNEEVTCISGHFSVDPFSAGLVVRYLRSFELSSS